MVVAGSGKKVGKTAVACQIIAATREACWIAIKITSHWHGASPREEQEVSVLHDTGRFLAAGAHRSFLICASGSEIALHLQDIPPGNWIIESNSAAAALHPDITLFVTGEGDKLPPAPTTHTVPGRITSEALKAIRQLLPD